jgi:hypothetical protein
MTYISLSVYSRMSIFFSSPAAVTITGNRAANLDLCLALMAISIEFFFVSHLLQHGTLVYRSHSKDRHPR